MKSLREKIEESLQIEAFGSRMTNIIRKQIDKMKIGTASLYKRIPKQSIMIEHWFDYFKTDEEFNAQKATFERVYDDLKVWCEKNLSNSNSNYIDSSKRYEIYVMDNEKSKDTYDHYEDLSDFMQELVKKYNLDVEIEKRTKQSYCTAVTTIGFVRDGIMCPIIEGSLWMS